MSIEQCLYIFYKLTSISALKTLLVRLAWRLFWDYLEFVWWWGRRLGARFIKVRIFWNNMIPQTFFLIMLKQNSWTFISFVTWHPSWHELLLLKIASEFPFLFPLLFRPFSSCTMLMYLLLHLQFTCWLHYTSTFVLEKKRKTSVFPFYLDKAHTHCVAFLTGGLGFIQFRVLNIARPNKKAYDILWSSSSFPTGEGLCSTYISSLLPYPHGFTILEECFLDEVGGTHFIWWLWLWRSSLARRHHFHK